MFDVAHFLQALFSFLMRPMSLSRHTLALCLGFHVVAARFLHSLPEDTYAFPKYRVSFLNGLPVLKDTAERWLQDGLRGGELEFLDQSWKDALIGNGEAAEPDHPNPSNVTLEHMKMGPDNSYICLIPPSSLDSPAPPVEEPQEEEVIPAKSWALLKPLADKCLYHRQPWFTYSYCHNHEIRQFRELPPSQPPSPGAYEPQEDPEWESYTLGRAPPVPEPGVDLSVTQESAANLELARDAGSRYLVQRWGDGEICDMTGKHREVEVQFHCSMTTTDSIILVREAKTCSYVFVIHTPRLCGEPGFKSRLESRDESYIRCREIVESIEPSTNAESPLMETDRPLHKVSQRQPVLTVPSRPPTEPPAGDAGSGKGSPDANGRLRQILEAVLANNDAGDFSQVFVEQINIGQDGEEDVVFQFEIDDIIGGQPDEQHEEVGTRRSLLEALRAAGIDVKGEKKSEKKEQEEEEEEEDGEEPPQARDEL